MMAILGASGFIGRSITDYLGARSLPYRALLRDPNAVPGEAFPNAASVDAFEIGGDMDMRLFQGVDTLLLTTSATKPNLRHNGLVNEVQKNVLPHCQLFQNLAQTDVRHLIFLSSGGAVYGSVDQQAPIRENQPRVPCTPYGYGKLCIESAIEAQWVGEGRRFTIIRPSNPVGPHQIMSLGAHGLFPTVFANIMKGKPVNVFGDGTTVRDYFSVYDLADLIQRVAGTPEVGSQIVNASSGQGLSINQVVSTCAEVLGVTPQVQYIAEKQPEIGFNVLCNARAREVFGWTPTYSVEAIAEDLKSYLLDRAALTEAQ